MTTNVKDIINNNQYRPYLDNGFVGLIDIMGDDNRIDMAARVSYGGNSRTRSKEEITRLIRYLMANKHTSPFEMVELLFHIKLPIFVMRQHIRHRTACLTGDTKVSFKNGKTVTIKTLYKNNHKTFNVDKINKNCYYTANKIGKWFTKKLYDNEYPIDVYRLKANNGNYYEYYYGQDIINLAEWYNKSQNTNQSRCSPVISLNEDKKTIHLNNTVAQVWKSGVKQVFEVTAEQGTFKRSIKASADHLFFTENGWVKLKDLLVGGKLWCVNNNSFTMTPPIINTETEEWKSIYNDFLYEVSTEGRVRNATNKELLPKKFYLENYWVIIYNKPEKISSLVMETFNPRKDYTSIIKRLDGNLLNDKLSNLEWIDMNKDLINFNNYSSYSSFLAEITSIVPLGIEQTYDLSIDGEYHNFAANDFIVHNSVNEYSGRYSKMDDEFYTPPIDRALGQALNNKQQSTNNVSSSIAEDFINHLETSYSTSFNNYQSDIDNGISKEIARIQLPLANYTELYWKINLHNFFRYIGLRDDEEHAQTEIVQLAKIMYGFVKDRLPIACQAFEDYQKNSISFSNDEVDLLHDIFNSRSLSVIDDNTKLSKREKDSLKLKLNKIIGENNGETR